METPADALHPPTQGPTLPLALLYAIAEFAADRPTHLRAFAQLSRASLAYAERVYHMNLRPFWLLRTSEMASPDGLEPLYRSRITPLKELRVLINDWKDTSFLLDPNDDNENAAEEEDNGEDENDDNALSLWCEIMAQLPELETLRMAHRPSWQDALTPAHVLPTIRAAAWLCPQLHTLALPKLVPHQFDDVETLEQFGTTAEAVLDGLLNVLPAWKPLGGLRHLVIPTPFGVMRDRHVKATQLVTSLATNCPLLERIVSSTLRLGGQQFVHDYVPDEHWHIGLDTWERFCATCSQLTEFDWDLVPYATAFFEVFGRYPNPQLRTLTIVQSSNWDWASYRRAYPQLTGGVAETAQHAHAVLLACPNLRDLSIGDDYRVRDSIFGDTFIEALALHCRRLERLEIRCVVMGDARDTTRSIHATAITAAETFTDRAMDALATLPMLTHVSLRAVNVTGDGLFRLAVDFSPSDWKPLRSYELCVGAHGSNGQTTAFHDVIVQFLTRLAQWESGDSDGSRVPLPCATERVRLHVHNGDPVPWHARDCADLTRLVTTVLTRHPTIGVRIAVTRPLSSVHYDYPVAFHTITDVYFHTKRATRGLGATFTSSNDEASLAEVFVDPTTADADWNVADQPPGGTADGPRRRVNHAATCRPNRIFVYRAE